MVSDLDGNGSFSSHIAGSGLADCFRFWLAQREGARPPLKRKIDPTEMPRRILPYLFIYESIGARFRCRLAGTAIAHAFREDPTGRFLDELVRPLALESRSRLFAGVIEREVPVVYGGKLAAGPNDWMTFKRLLLPVSMTGDKVDIVFGMVVFPQLDRASAHNRSIKDMDHEFEAWASPQDLQITA